MLKRSFYSIILTAAFAATPTLSAGNAQQAQADKSANADNADRYEDKRVPGKPKHKQVGDAETKSNHPAHDMADPAQRINEERKEDYEDHRVKAAEKGNALHPSHEMDEVEPVEKRGQ